MPELVKLPLIAILGVGSLILLVMMHLVLVAVCDVVLVAAFTAGVCFLRRHTLVVHNVPKTDAPASVQTALLAPARRAIAAPELFEEKS